MTRDEKIARVAEAIRELIHLPPNVLVEAADKVAGDMTMDYLRAAFEPEKHPNIQRTSPLATALWHLFVNYAVRCNMEDDAKEKSS